MKLLLIYCKGCEGVTASKIGRYLKDVGIAHGRGNLQEGSCVWAYSLSNESAETLQITSPSMLNIPYVSEPVPYSIGPMPWISSDK